MPETIMYECIAEANKIIEKAKSHKEYAGKLRGISGSLNTLPLDLNDALSLFLNGGYVSEGEALCQSEISSLASKSGTITSEINSLVTKTEQEIEKFRKKYYKVEFKFETAKNSYLASESCDGTVPTFPEFII